MELYERRSLFHLAKTFHSLSNPLNVLSSQHFSSLLKWIIRNCSFIVLFSYDFFSFYWRSKFKKLITFHSILLFLHPDFWGFLLQIILCVNLCVCVHVCEWERKRDTVLQCICHLGGNRASMLTYVFFPLLVWCNTVLQFYISCLFFIFFGGVFWLLENKRFLCTLKILCCYEPVDQYVLCSYLHQPSKRQV